MKRDLLGLAAIILLAAGAGCTTDPTDSLSEGIGTVSTSLSHTDLVIGDSVAVTAETKDNQGVAIPDPLPTFVSLTPAIVSVTEANVAPLAQTRFYIKALTYGTGEVEVTAGGETVTITIDTWPARIDITGVPDTMRSGETATATLTALDANGDPVAGTDITLESSDEDVLALDAATLVVTGVEAGVSTLNATGPNSSGSFPVLVLPGVPASAELSAATFGAVAAGSTSKLELLVLDAAGNQNTNIGEITSVAVNSSDVGVATVAAAIVDTADEGTRREIFVTATGVASGTANISGSVTTTEGVFPFAATPVTVLDPQVTASGPSGLPGATITINGTGLAAAGFETVVLVDGAPVGNVTAVSATQVTAQMPTLLAGTYDLEVSVGGIVSNADTWTQTVGYVELGSEPNNAQGQEAPISASFEFSGTADETLDFSDLFEFTVSADDLVIDLELAWGDASDLDVLIYLKGAQDPGDYAEDACEFDLSSLSNPETGTCTLGSAGTYTLEILHYGTGPTTYTVKGTIRN